MGGDLLKIAAEKLDSACDAREAEASVRRRHHQPLPLRPGERGTPLSAVDVAWLRMDEPSNLMHIHGVLVLGGGRLDASRRTCSAGAWRRSPGSGSGCGDEANFGRLVWVDDADFDLARHVIEERLDEPGDDAELAATIAEHLSRPFDRAHPLWEFRLLRGYRGATRSSSGGCTTTIGDGVALMMVLLAMTDLTPHGPASARRQPIDPACRPRSEIVNPFLDLFRRPAGGARRHAPGARGGDARDAAPDAGADRGDAAGAPAAQGAGAAAALGRLVGRWNDPATPFKGKLGVDKRVAWTDRLPLERFAGSASRSAARSTTCSTPR